MTIKKVLSDAKNSLLHLQQTKVFPLFVKIAVKAGNLIKVCQLYFYLAKINHGKMSVKEVLKGTMLRSKIGKLPKWCQVLHSCTQ